MSEHCISERTAPLRRNGILRAVALVLLTVFLPASVLAGPMRYCLGRDGHREIEFLHGRSAAHAFGALADFARSARDDAIVRHFESGHCQDRLLLAKATKCSGLRANASKLKSAAGPSALGRRNLTSISQLPMRDGHAKRRCRNVLVDPRLVSLRTIVLLN